MSSPFISAEEKNQLLPYFATHHHIVAWYNMLFNLLFCFMDEKNTAEKKEKKYRKMLNSGKLEFPDELPKNQRKNAATLYATVFESGNSANVEIADKGAIIAFMKICEIRNKAEGFEINRKMTLLKSNEEAFQNLLNNCFRYLKKREKRGNPMPKERVLALLLTDEEIHHLNRRDLPAQEAQLNQEEKDEMDNESVESNNTGKEEKNAIEQGENGSEDDFVKEKVENIDHMNNYEHIEIEAEQVESTGEAETDNFQIGNVTEYRAENEQDSNAKYMKFNQADEIVELEKPDECSFLDVSKHKAATSNNSNEELINVNKRKLVSEKIVEVKTFNDEPKKEKNEVEPSDEDLDDEPLTKKAKITSGSATSGSAQMPGAHHSAESSSQFDCLSDVIGFKIATLIQNKGILPSGIIFSANNPRPPASGEWLDWYLEVMSELSKHIPPETPVPKFLTYPSISNVWKLSDVAVCNWLLTDNLLGTRNA